MKKAAILLMCFGLFGLTSCKKVNNEFTVRDPEGVVATAELRLCGKRLQLTKAEGELSGRTPITCEGSGSIMVRLSDGRKTTCPIGYVTSGSELAFEYTIEGGQCR